MRKLSWVALFVALLWSPVLADEPFKTVKTVNPNELASMMASKPADLAICDANGGSTRERYGVIPGARLLTSSTKYEVAELPAAKDSKLVFYCANEQCMASHAAAKRAIENGYTNVAILPEGIMGWEKAGKPIAKP